MAIARRLEIMKEAAAHIGAKLVIDADVPGTGAQRDIHDRFDLAVREILERRPWHSAMKRAKVAPMVADELHPGYMPYPMPGKAVRAWFVKGGCPEFYVEGRIFYIKHDQPLVFGFTSLETEDKWTPGLIGLMGLYLGSKVALSRKDSQSRQDRLDKKFMKQLRIVGSLEGKRKSAQFLENERINY